MFDFFDSLREILRKHTTVYDILGKIYIDALQFYKDETTKE